MHLTQTQSNEQEAKQNLYSSAEVEKKFNELSWFNLK